MPAGYYNDPSGLGSWYVPEGYTPQNSPFHPAAQQGQTGDPGYGANPVYRGLLTMPQTTGQVQPPVQPPAAPAWPGAPNPAAGAPSPGGFGGTSTTFPGGNPNANTPRQPIVNSYGSQQAGTQTPGTLYPDLATGGPDPAQAAAAGRLPTTYSSSPRQATSLGIPQGGEFSSYSSEPSAVPRTPYNIDANGTVTPGGASTPPGEPGATGGPDPNSIEGLFGLNNIPQIGQINLGTMPTMASNFGDDFTNNYNQTAGNYGQQVGAAWNYAQPTAQTAYNNLQGIPQPNAQQVGANSGMDFLLSGQGFDPATLARMRASATDDISRQGIAQGSAARLAASRAGLGNSGASVALANNIARDTGAQTNQALNNIDIQNAQQGMTNLTTGAGMELNRGQSNAQQANMMALQNAANMLSSMQQNTSNLQQSNMANFQGQQQQAQGRATAQSNFAAGAGQNLLTGQTQRANTAAQQNAANQYNWNLNQANLNRERDIFNTNTAENRWQTGANGLINLTNGTQQGPLSAQATNVAIQPRQTIAATIANAANGVATQR